MKQLYFALFLASIFILQTAYALQEFEVHKLVQYSKDDKSMGSQRASFNLLATFPSETVENPHRRMLILELSVYNLTMIDMSGKQTNLLTKYTGTTKPYQ
jgi:hypothetical protein